MNIREHYCEDGGDGAILSASCPNCGCAYRYCAACQACDESAEPEDDCTDLQCGCHTDTRAELAAEPHTDFQRDREHIDGTEDEEWERRRDFGF